jgi:hypothetical protein
MVEMLHLIDTFRKEDLDRVQVVKPAVFVLRQPGFQGREEQEPMFSLLQILLRSKDLICWPFPINNQYWFYRLGKMT